MPAMARLTLIVPSAACLMLGHAQMRHEMPLFCAHSGDLWATAFGGTIMALAINDTAPDFEAQTTEGKIKFHDWIGDKWAVLFSHPKDFTPICTTELGYMAKIKPEFDRRGVKVIGLSVDATTDHEKWAQEI